MLFLLFCLMIEGPDPYVVLIQEAQKHMVPVPKHCHLGI